MTPLQSLRQAIISAVPEIKKMSGWCDKCCCTYYGNPRYDFPARCINERCEYPLDISETRPITLEDVLRWYQFDVIWEDSGWLRLAEHERSERWILGKSLDQQPQPVIDFLASLLPSG